MIICAAGDIHGQIDWFYADVLAFEKAAGIRFDLVLHVGDFGIWPDPARVDRATRKHDGGAGDFPHWLGCQQHVPRPTVFIKGNHEDFDWLESGGCREILPGLTWLPNGAVLEIGGVRIGGIGGCYSYVDFKRLAESLPGQRKRHFTEDEVERLVAQAPLDVLLLHDAPAGVEFAKQFDDGTAHSYVSATKGLVEAILGTRPRVCFFGHHHFRVDAEVAGVHCIGLNLVRRTGYLVAAELEPGGRECKIIGEFGGVSPLDRWVGALDHLRGRDPDDLIAEMRGEDD